MFKKSTIVSAALAAMGQAMLMAFMLAPTAHAQCPEYTCDPPGTLKCCPGSSATTFQAQGGTVSITATTNGCFIINSCSLPAGCGGAGWDVDMRMDNFSGTATDPLLGTITWMNDPDRPGSSHLRSYDPKSQFPAQGEIRFFAMARVVHPDGTEETYRSDREVILHNQNIMSWNPFVNERFTTIDAEAGIVFTGDVSGDQITLMDLVSTLN